MSELIDTFSSRTFSITGYSTPLFVQIIDAAYEDECPFVPYLQNILLVPSRKVVTSDNWLRIADISLRILKDDGFWQREIIRFEIPDYRRKHFQELTLYFRNQTQSILNRVMQDPTFFAYQGLSNMIYQASEGLDFDTDYQAVATISPSYQLTSLLNNELFEQIRNSANLNLGRDDLILWRRTNNLIFNTVSQEFKANFNPILSYEVPFGMSPRNKSETIEALIKNSKTIALVPMISGIHSISTALSNNQWVLALEATVATGGVVIGLMSTIALSDWIISWMKKREIEKQG